MRSRLPGDTSGKDSQMARVISVNTSEEKGTRKNAVEQGDLKKEYGFAGDAHADFSTHRQVSLLAAESISKMRSLGLILIPGDFAENITTEDIDLLSLPIGTRLNVGEKVVLEISQIGKECHAGCAIFRQVGKCIMPKEGIFARVLAGGSVKAGDEIRIIGD